MTQNILDSKVEILESLGGENIFAALMSAARHCSLHQMTQALFEVGGQYRRNL